jgi:hypothetical protein
VRPPASRSISQIITLTAPIIAMIITVLIAARPGV